MISDVLERPNQNESLNKTIEIQKPCMRQGQAIMGPLEIPCPDFMPGETRDGLLIFVRFALECTRIDRKIVYSSYSRLSRGLIKQNWPRAVDQLYIFGKLQGLTNDDQFWRPDFVYMFWRLGHIGLDNDNDCIVRKATILQERTHQRRDDCNNNFCTFSAEQDAGFGRSQIIFPVFDIFKFNPVQGDTVFIHKRVIAYVEDQE